VFVDWHGVLCDAVFWQSITRSDRHQRRRHLDDAVSGFFGKRFEDALGWMRGEIDAWSVVSMLGRWDDRRCKEDFLFRRLHEDCRRMRPRDDLLHALAGLPPLTLIVIATDNMDCFSASLPAIRALRGRFHAVLCSSDLGVLKAEDPSRFFGELLTQNGLTPDRALLIDDSALNCREFERFGGKAIHFADTPQAAAAMQDWSVLAD
jgi:FMN phosphatase YigB (HAD superfamily)